MKNALSRILTAVIALCVLLCSVPMVSVSAAEPTVVNDEAGLIAAAAAGGEITVNEQINVFTQIVVKKDLVINLNNYISFFEALDATVPSNLVIEGASLTINCDDKIDVPKGILYAGKARLCSLVSTAERPATLTINNGSYHAGNVSRPEGFVCPESAFEAVTLAGGQKPQITINGGSVYSEKMNEQLGYPDQTGELLKGDATFVINCGVFNVDPKDYVPETSAIYYDSAWQVVPLAQEISPEFATILNSKGELVLKRYAPANEMDVFVLFDALYFDYFEFASGPKFNFISASYNNDDKTIIAQRVDENYNVFESRKVKLVFECDEATRKEIEEIASKLPAGKDVGGYVEPYRFTVTDLELINYWSACTEERTNENVLINYSDEFKKLIGYKNFLIDTRMGNSDRLYTFAQGIAEFKYNGTVYAGREMAVQANHILYVPDSTEDTAEAVTAAAQKRVDEYLGKDKVKLVYMDTLFNVIDAEHFAETGTHLSPDIDLEVELETEGVKKDDYCFKITVNDLEHQLIVRRDSGKMVTPVYKSVDMATNVSVNTTDSSVPLDTVMKVDELKSGTVYEDIIKTLDVEDNVTYDIKLQSESLDKHITKLNNGKFEVKIPVPEALKGQNLTVYYVDENKKITEHKTTKTDDGYAVFETDHFSIYTLAAKGDSPYTQSPATSDSPISVAAALASLIAVAFAYKKCTIHNA